MLLTEGLALFASSRHHHDTTSPQRPGVQSHSASGPSEPAEPEIGRAHV